MSPSILIIEDYVQTLASIRAAFEIRGWDVFEATSLAEARKALADHRYDVILSDYDLGDGTAVDLFQENNRKGAFTMVWSGLDRTKECETIQPPLDALEGKENMPEVIRMIHETKFRRPE